ncbi:MAG TPA: RecX family transcriptional regulator [Gemmatimonadales bacterium]|nr:RecX family transcriptional regulator [Gemmatimonadales bacterium]
MTLPVLTALEPDPRRPGTLRVEVDGVRFGAVPEALARGAGLAVGRPVDAALQEQLTAAADAEGAFRTLLRALERRSFARADLGRRLLRKGHPRPAVEAALERADGLGLLDDAAFAETFVQTRAARGRGPARLVRDLLAMGVERSYIDRALAVEWPEGSDRTRVPTALAAKRAAQLGDLSRAVKRRRVLAYLARRGFAGRDISELVVRVVG